MGHPNAQSSKEEPWWKMKTCGYWSIESQEMQMSQGEGVRCVRDAHRSSKKPEIWFVNVEAIGNQQEQFWWGGAEHGCCEFCCNRSRGVGCLLLAKAESSLFVCLFVLDGIVAFG